MNVKLQLPRSAFHRMHELCERGHRRKRVPVDRVELLTLLADHSRVVRAMEDAGIEVVEVREHDGHEEDRPTDHFPNSVRR